MGAGVLAAVLMGAAPPWEAVAVGAGVGVLVGLIVSRFANVPV